MLNRFFFNRSKSDLSNENNVEKKTFLMNVKILNLNKNSVAEIEINNKMMKKKCVAVETNEKTMKKN